MKTLYGLYFLFMLSAVISGCTSANQLPKPKVYVILEITVHDSEVYEQYREKVEPIIEQYGGRYLVRSGAKSFDNNPASSVISPEGDWYPDRIIVLEFDSAETVKKFTESPEYKAVVHLRTDSSSTRSVLVNGYYPPGGNLSKQ